MALFGKGKNRLPAADAEREEAPMTPDTPDASAREPEERGPWDFADVDGLGSRLDLGALWVPQGLRVGLEVAENSAQPIAVSVSRPGATMRLQAFAAPKTAGIWDEIRAELAEQAENGRGRSDDIPGPFGRELLAYLPADNAKSAKLQPVRFWGVDGPRWFLRAVLTGEHILDDAAADQLADVFADTVVVRGPEARAPRELLDLHTPGHEAVAQSGDSLDPMHRGPEITEVR